MPAETAQAMCCVFMGGVLERHPRLRLCFAHAGGSYAMIQSRVAHGHRVRPDLCAAVCARPPAELVKMVWVDSLTHNEHLLQLVIDMCGEVNRFSAIFFFFFLNLNFFRTKSSSAPTIRSRWAI
jgi:aminocarboxymuconate-semialdehyde decarboxylase